jgi:hypothetical protein
LTLAASPCWAPAWAANSLEPRLAACIANDGLYDFAYAFLGMIPPEQRGTFVAQIKAPPGPSPLDATLIGMAKASPVARWFFANGTWAFGANSPRELLRKVLDYNLRDGIAEKIRCPTLVCDAEDDLYLGGQAGELFSRLTCKKTLLRFTKAEGAGAHCQMGAGLLAFARIFDWLDETLAPG